MRCFTKAMVLLASAAIWCGCSPKATAPKPPAKKPAAIRSLPVAMTVKQRSTTAVPGSDIRLTLDDITRGQVMVSLVDKDGGAVLAATSLNEGASAAFTLNDEAYQLTLRDLDNELVGDDFATLVISSGSIPARKSPSVTSSPSPSSPSPPPDNRRAPKANAASEREKIDRLLAATESDTEVVFIRNDAEHSAKEAAEHLRAKWSAAGDDIDSADDFIEKVASRSSLSGEPYRVRLPDGTIVLAGDYLRGRLSEIENRQAADE